MTAASDISRREFLRVSAIVTGGLLFSFQWPARAQHHGGPPLEPPKNQPNAWIQIDPDNTVILTIPSAEMGQGALTAVAMLLVEELEADWQRIKTQFAPAADIYRNPASGRQLTGGSRTVRGFWQPLREVGATVREMLITAAAQQWNVEPNSCHAQDSYVMHRDSNRRVSFGEIAGAAAKLPIPKDIPLKPRSAFRLVGKPTRHIDAPLKVNGSAVFGQDVAVPGALVAVIARCPVFGGKAVGFDAKAAGSVKGVRHVVEVGSGIAVVADHFWAAESGRDKLDVKWDEGPLAKLDDGIIQQKFREAIEQGAVANKQGDATAALSGAAKKLDAIYETPYLAHACMEPMNCTAHVTDDSCNIWVPTQGAGPVQQRAMKLTGLPPDKVHVHPTFLGGGFGRRSEVDFVEEAVQISQAIKGPVKVMWTREDDIQHDVYRPATYNVLAAALDGRGKPLAWSHKIAAPSILTRLAPMAVQGGMDPTATEGARDIPYDIPNQLVSYAMVNPGVPVGFWRSVGHSQNAFIVESFIDELAALANQDPLTYRLELLANAPRHKNVLALAAAKANWKDPPAAGRGRGLAVVKSFEAYVAQVAEISIDEQHQLRVHRVTCVVDCGAYVNPNTIVAQMESGIVFGLTAALKGKTTIRNGRVAQSNFHDYPLLRMDEMPQIDVHIVDSDEPPSGIGETAVPPIAPAVANAVYALTGNRIRRLPIELSALA